MKDYKDKSNDGCAGIDECGRCPIAQQSACWGPMAGEVFDDEDFLPNEEFDAAEDGWRSE